MGLVVIPIRDDGTCCFGTIDIDLKDYPNLDIIAVSKEVWKRKLPLVPCRSKSGALHLILPCKEDTSAELVQEKLMDWAAALGFPDAEIFPKQTRLAGPRDWGSSINLPYFGGDATDRYAIINGERMDLAQFLDAMESTSVTIAQLEAIPSQKSAPSSSPSTPPKVAVEEPSRKVDTQRNNFLTKRAGWQRRKGDSPALIETYLLALNEEMCDPPLPEKEVREIARGMGRYEPVEGEAESRPLIQRLSDLLADSSLLKPPTPIAPRFGWRGRSTLLASREKAGKTTLASYIAARVSSGSELFGEPTVENGATVLWVILEGHLGETAHRLVGFGGFADSIYILDRLPKGLDTLADAALEAQPALIVVDTLSSLVEGVISDHSNDAAGWTSVMNGLGRIARDADAGLIVLHHARKSDGKYRDSSAIGAGVDMILEMFEVENDPTLRLFKPRGRWTLEPFGVRFDELAMSYMLSTGELPLETRVLDFIRRNPGCSQNAVRTKVTGKREAVDAAVSSLIRRGIVADDTRGGGHAYSATGPVERPGVESWSDRAAERYEDM